MLFRSGEIPEKVNGSGVLINSGKLTGITYSSGGIVKDVFLKRGDMVHDGQVIARIERQDLLESVQIAEQRLENLQQNYNAAIQLSRRSSGLTDAMLAKSEKDLTEQINTLANQIENAQLKLNNMESLYNDGLVTGTAYMSARNELFNLQRQKQDAERQLMSAGVDRIRTTGDTDKQLLSLQQQIDEARKQLEIQQDSYQTATRVLSSESGIVYEVAIARGSYLSPGATIAVIEPFASDGVVLEATMFFALQDGKRIKRGMSIAVSPSTVKQEEFGYIQGIVTSVSPFPSSPQYLMATLQNQGLVQFFSNIAAPIEVRVSLIPDPETVTGYHWSSSKGPDEQLDTGTLCSGSVTVRTQRPIELVIPLIKKKILGIGE